MTFYVAYGSNLHPLRLSERLGPQTPLARLQLRQLTLKFHKRGNDGSAKCDLVNSSQDSWGVLYQLQPTQLVQLDRYEGGYQRHQLEVTWQGNQFAAITYRAQCEFIDDQLAPFDWYRELILAGAEAFGFEAGYLQALRQVDGVADPDPLRRHQQQTLLKQLRGHRPPGLRQLSWGEAYATSTIS